MKFQCNAYSISFSVIYIYLQLHSDQRSSSCGIESELWMSCDKLQLAQHDWVVLEVLSIWNTMNSKHLFENWKVFSEIIYLVKFLESFWLCLWTLTGFITGIFYKFSVKTMWYTVCKTEKCLKIQNSVFHRFQDIKD